MMPQDINNSNVADTDDPFGDDYTAFRVELLFLFSPEQTARVNRLLELIGEATRVRSEFAALVRMVIDKDHRRELFEDPIWIGEEAFDPRSSGYANAKRHLAKLVNEFIATAVPYVTPLPLDD